MIKRKIPIAVNQDDDFVYVTLNYRQIVENGWLEKFINNHYNKNKNNIKEFGKPNLNIDNAFTWSATPERDNFWDDLNDRYEALF